jgi:hypothetical protein
MRPQIALRVGITGHRWREALHAPHERLGKEQAEPVREAMRVVLRRIHAAVAAHQQRHAGRYAESAPVLSLVCALAEGADELAAGVACEPAVGYALDVVAPYDLAAHAPRCAPGTPLRTLWDAARARLVLDGLPLADMPRDGETSARDEAALVETNRRLVWNSDLVIAIWDGLDARGVAGTARVIERARAEGLPVLHMHSNDPSRLAVLDAHGGDTLPADPLAAIDAVVERLLAVHHGPSDSAEQSRALDDFANESPPAWPVRTVSSQVYSVAMWLLTGFDGAARPRALRASPAETTVPWGTQSARLDDAFRRADYYATAYGARHRSTFTTILFLAPLAVLCAWAGSLATPHDKLYWALGELVLLSILLLFYANSRRLRFHARWLDYRLLAERLRQLGFLWPLGRNSPVIRVPAHGTSADPRMAWANWWYRAVTREIGLTNVAFTPEVLRRLAHTLSTECVLDQAAYNRRAHHVAHRAEGCLHSLPWIPLVLTLLAAATHVIEHLIGAKPEEWFTNLLTTIGIFGPAIGAALHGFASQAGLPEVGIRTAATVQQLDRFAERLAAVDLTRPLASAQVGAIALNVADVMGGDLAGWRVDYLARPVNPPG